MKLSSYNQFNYDLVKFGIDYACEHARAVGFDAVEFLAGDGSLPVRFPAEDVKAALKRNGLTVSCFSAFADLVNGSYDLIPIIDYASELGSPYFHHTVLPELRVPSVYDDVFDTAVKKATEIARYAEGKGITVLYEPQGLCFNGVSGLGKFAESIRKNISIGICGDIGNSLFVDEEPSGVMSAFAKDIKHSHLKDFFYSDSEIVSPPQYRSKAGKHLCDAKLFEGDIDIAACLKVIKESGYDSFFSLEFTASDEETKETMKKLSELWDSL